MNWSLTSIAVVLYGVMTWLVSLSIGIPKASPICCAIRGHSQLGFRCFMSTTAAMTSWLGPLGPGFIGAFDENSRRYFRWISARCRRNSVDGLKIIAERINGSGG